MAKILVVDDKTPHRRLIMDILEMEKFKVIGAENGREALEIMRKQKIDLVTLDQQMPGMNGLQCYQQMDKKIPAIFITVFGNESEFEEIKRLGIPVITKPLIPDDIINTVKKLLNSL